MTPHSSLVATAGRLPLVLQQALIGFVLIVSMQIPVWLSPVGTESYMFWPVTGFAVATLLHRPQLFPGIAAALWLWGVLGPLGWLMGTLNLLTLAGPLIYWQVDKRWHFPDSEPKRRLTGLGLLVVFSLLPSAVIGTLLIVLLTGLTLESAFLALLIYLLSEFAGTVVFLPLVGQWLTRKQPVSWYCIALVAAVVALPLLLPEIGLGIFSQVSLFMVLPVLIGIAQIASRPTLSHALLVVFIAHLSMAYFGKGGYSPINEMAQMASLALLLLAVFISMDTLQAMRVDRDRALRQSRWQAEHDHRSPALNERGLIHWSEQQQLEAHGGVLYKPVNNQIYLQTLSWEQLGKLEAWLVRTLQQLLPSATIAKVSDLTLVAVLPSKDLNIEQLENLLEIRFDVDETSFTIDGAIASFTQLGSDMTGNLAKLNTLWSTAVKEPNLRLGSEASVLDVASRQSRIDVFQRYRNAVENGGLALWLQPIQSLGTGMTTKAEVLARLNTHTRDGQPILANPGDFLPVFQVFNYLTEFDRQVLEHTFRHFEQMQSSLGKAGMLNINITGATLSDKDLIVWLSSSLEVNEVNPRLVCIEITETDKVENRSNAIANIEGLRALGFQVAIDDFGTGLASFEYLNHFPVNVLKIDGQFISDIAGNEQHQAIVRAMVNVAESYRLDLVGEFVDSEAALACLRELGVHYAQGYYIGKPSDKWQLTHQSPPPDPQ